MSHHWLSPYSNNTPCLLHVCCDVTTVKPWQFLSSHQLRKEGVNRESPGMRLSLVWTAQQKDADLARSQVLQKFLRRKGWTNTHNCCPYIPRLVPNTCGFRVTSWSNIHWQFLRYSPRVRDIHELWIYLCIGTLAHETKQFSATYPRIV